MERVSAPPAAAAAPPNPVDPKDKPLMARFKQQQLPAWQPILTPGPVIITFLVVGVIFLPIGIVLLVTSNNVTEVSVRYDNDPACFNNSVCQITLSMPAMAQPVYFYYKLDNFYQNHRRYVKSRNDDQLAGSSVNGSSNASLFYSPCGLIAWSTFNDSFALQGPGSSLPFQFDTSSIAWPSDVNKKFKNPPAGSPGVNTLNQTLFPENIQDQRFIVWMRVAGLPSFRKLYGIIDTSLQAGDYTLTIDNRYPVYQFGGKKYVVISTNSWAGGKNNFLGIAYIVVGSLSLGLALLLFVLHKIKPRPLGDPSYLKWR